MPSHRNRGTSRHGSLHGRLSLHKGHKSSGRADLTANGHPDTKKCTWSTPCPRTKSSSRWTTAPSVKHKDGGPRGKQDDHGELGKALSARRPQTNQRTSRTRGTVRRAQKAAQDQPQAPQRTPTRPPSGPHAEPSRHLSAGRLGQNRHGAPLHSCKTTLWWTRQTASTRQPELRTWNGTSILEGHLAIPCLPLHMWE